MPVLAWFDVVLLVVATPIVLLIGVPAAGYCVAAAAWIVLRLMALAVERFVGATDDPNRQIAARMGLMFVRLFGLAIVVVLLRKSGGQDAGITALVVVVVAFTIALLTAPFGRPTRPARTSHAPSVTPGSR